MRVLYVLSLFLYFLNFFCNEHVLIYSKKRKLLKYKQELDG